jgi:signal transduction histidine kinase
MHTIRAKFATGFALIICGMLLLLNLVMGIYLRSSNDNAIAKELSSFRGHGNVYVRQAILVNDLTNDEASFEILAEEIVFELGEVMGAAVAAYSVDGRLLSASDRGRFLGADYRDLENARGNSLSFTVVREGEGMDAYFAFPVVVADERIGILRVCKSYVDLKQRTDDMRTLMFSVSAVMFVGGYIFLTVFSNSISKPILALARATSRVPSTQRVLLRPSGRSDEIGWLIDNYNAMVRRIERQIRIIEHDRDALSRLNAHRKDFYDQLTHELKTPLTTIMGYAEVIARNGFHDEAFFNMGMQYIIEQSRQLDEMVRSLLEYSKGISRVSEKPARVDLSALCVRTAEEMQIKAGRYSCECVADVEAGVFVDGVEAALKRLLLNLIDNAIKYGKRGELIHVRLAREGARAALRVENRGETLDQEQIRKVFTPFYQTNPSEITEAGSAGLGLYIVKNIVDEHRGRVSIQSSDGVTVVTVYLDLAGEGGAADEA